MNLKCMVWANRSCHEPGLDPVNRKFVIPVHRSCHEQGLDPVKKMYDFGSPELLQARSGSGEPKINDFVHRSCHEPGLDPINENK